MGKQQCVEKDKNVRYLTKKIFLQTKKTRPVRSVLLYNFLKMNSRAVLLIIIKVAGIRWAKERYKSYVSTSIYVQVPR